MDTTRSNTEERKIIERKIMRLTTAGHGYAHFFEGVIPPLIPLLMLQFGVDYFRMGLIVTVFSYAYGFGSLPAGWITDKVGSKWLISVFLFGASILSLMTFFITGYYGYMVLMGALGLLCSIYHPTANTLISHGMAERGKAYGIHGISGSVSVAATPVIAAFLGSRFGWNSAYIIFGVLGLAAAAYSLTLPTASGGKITEEKKDGTDKDEKAPPKIFFLAFFLSVAALGMAYRGVMTFLPVYMSEKIVFGGGAIDKVTIGGIVTTISLLSGAVGQYAGGKIADKRSPEIIYATASFIGGIFVFLMSFTETYALVLSAIFFAFFFFASQPVQNFIIARYLPKRMRGIGFGLHFFVVFSVGSVGAAISGFLADRFGLSSVYVVMAGCFFFASLMGLYLIRRSKSMCSI